LTRSTSVDEGVVRVEDHDLRVGDRADLHWSVPM
jgi:hypothetical protein